MPRHLPTALLRRPWAMAWVLLVAVLLALSPTLNHALAYAGLDGARAMDICTSQGPQSLAAPSAHADASAEPQRTPAPTSAPPPHCPLCLLQADRHAPPPAPLPPLRTLQRAQRPPPQRPPLLYVATALLWAAPRGPPTVIEM